MHKQQVCAFTYVLTALHFQSNDLAITQGKVANSITSKTHFNPVNAQLNGVSHLRGKNMCNNLML